MYSYLYFIEKEEQSPVKIDMVYHGKTVVINNNLPLYNEVMYNNQ